MDEVVDFLVGWIERAWTFLTDNPIAFFLVMFGLVVLLTWLGL